MATQELRKIKDNDVLTGYLTKKSASFYSFQNKEENGTIIIEVNNNNRRCLDLFIMKGTSLPTASSYDEKTLNYNYLVLQNASKSTYSISMIANEDCQYSFQLATTKNTFSKLIKGTFADINLEEGKEINFLF